MSAVIDVSYDCGSRAAALAAAGVRTVIRYYSRDTIRPTKQLTRAEAEQHANAGLRLAAVYEGRYGDKATNFDRATGVADAVYAQAYASDVIRQPTGSAIYFAVDFDATPTHIRDRIIPYFRGVADAFARDGATPAYKIGVYGSGATCRAVLDAGFAQLAWVAQSRGWAGYNAFLNSGRWTLKQGMVTSIGGVDCDPDIVADGQSMGDFALSRAAVVAGAELRPPAPMRVNARSGLRLRPGPGVEFDPVRTLPFGTMVYPLRSVDTWTLVDLDGDGAADGFVAGAFLVEQQAEALPPATLGFVEAIADAVQVPELIRQGSTAEGLAAARVKAAAALPGYPHNGCAAHLSALLQGSGIDVPMTFGAGKLAHIIADRGWSKISVGRQQAGDVGVCYDKDASVSGSDHIYLVVATRGTDEMMIADNQRTTDAPHNRFASGHGKTSTEYFLRAT